LRFDNEVRVREVRVVRGQILARTTQNRRLALRQRSPSPRGFAGRFFFPFSAFEKSAAPCHQARGSSPPPETGRKSWVTALPSSYR
jgi:hypothetical protein